LRFQEPSENTLCDSLDRDLDKASWSVHIIPSQKRDVSVAQVILERVKANRNKTVCVKEDSSAYKAGYSL